MAEVIRFGFAELIGRGAGRANWSARTSCLTLQKWRTGAHASSAVDDAQVPGVGQWLAVMIEPAWGIEQIDVALEVCPGGTLDPQRTGATDAEDQAVALLEYRGQDTLAMVAMRRALAEKARGRGAAAKARAPRDRRTRRRQVERRR